MTQRSRRLFALLSVSAAMSAAALPVAQAKNGADDPVNHDVNDDNGGLVVNQVPRSDDPVNHDVNDDRNTTVRKHEVRHHHHRRGHHHRRHDDRPGDR